MGHKAWTQTFFLRKKRWSTDPEPTYNNSTLCKWHHVSLPSHPNTSSLKQMAFSHDLGLIRRYRVTRGFSNLLWWTVNESLLASKICKEMCIHVNKLFYCFRFKNQADFTWFYPYIFMSLLSLKLSMSLLQYKKRGLPRHLYLFKRFFLWIYIWLVWGRGMAGAAEGL